MGESIKYAQVDQGKRIWKRGRIKAYIRFKKAEKYDILFVIRAKVKKRSSGQICRYRFNFFEVLRNPLGRMALSYLCGSRSENGESLVILRSFVNRIFGISTVLCFECPHL